MPRRVQITTEQNVLELAYERINKVFDRFDTISVAFSGGKDSTVCLNLTLEIAKARNRLPLDVMFIDEEAIPYQTVHYVERVRDHPDVSMRWFALPVKHRNACSREYPWWYPFDPEIPDLWVRKIPEGAITDVKGFNIWPVKERIQPVHLNGLFYDPREYGNTALIMGTRADESIIRRRAVTNREIDNYIIKFRAEDSRLDGGNLYKVYAIYDWKTEDVWTAPAKFGWDYNEAYDLMSMAGVPAFFQRCAPPFGEEPVRRLWTYRICFPEIWDKMCYRVPGANTAAMYAETELFAMNELPEKPEDQTWQEFIRDYVMKFSGDGRALVAHRIEQLLAGHFKKTPHPVVYSAPHPETGISWKYLLKLAMRGDFKSRRQAGSAIVKTPDEHWQEYRDAVLFELGIEIP